MKGRQVTTVLLVVGLLCVVAGAGEKLYNGIVLPDQWPPEYGKLKYAPMPVPYLENPPAVIPIDVGRQLFVDDFLIEKTTLQRTFHQPEYYRQNPVIKPDKPWENKRGRWYAGPFSGGAWYDPADDLFKLWYRGGSATCYATSTDGIHWEKPKLDVKRGTNIVLEPGGFDTTTVWLDHDAKDHKERFKYFATEGPGDRRLMTYRISADGIHWSEPKAKPEIWGERTTAFYNPFRDVWVLSQRIETGEAERRTRSYVEGPTALGLMAEVRYYESDKVEGKSVHWVGADDLDPRNPDPRFKDIKPQLYSISAGPYESLMLGLFAIWTGPDNRTVAREGIQKHCQILTGFSRDGFHWDRPDRKTFIGPSWKKGTWNFGNVQPVGGCCLVVGDKLYFYFSARVEDKTGMHGNATTGLALLRRDGFASMDAGEKTETLTTRPVTFQGKYLFVNADCPKGELKAEVLDKDGKVIEPFTLKNCKPVSSDKTLVQVNWKQNKDLAVLASKPVRFRFHLRNGSLYAFWVSPDKSGASHGYVGAGGPGFTGPTDTVGQSAVRTSR